jgi:hypothetical protein
VNTGCAIAFGIRIVVELTIGARMIERRVYMDMTRKNVKLES